MKDNLARKVNLREGGLGDITKPRDQRKDPTSWGDNICGRIDRNFVFDPKRDKLARQMPMDATLKRCMRKALSFAGVGPSALPSSPWPVTQPKSSTSTRKPKPAPKAGNVLKIVPKKVESTRRDSDLVDGRVFGKKIVTIRRKQGKRSCQKLGKWLLHIAGRNVGRGQVFYLSAAYGVIESR